MHAVIVRSCGTCSVEISGQAILGNFLDVCYPSCLTLPQAQTRALRRPLGSGAGTGDGWWVRTGLDTIDQ